MIPGLDQGNRALAGSRGTPKDSALAPEKGCWGDGEEAAEKFLIPSNRRTRPLSGSEDLRGASGVSARPCLGRQRTPFYL